MVAENWLANLQTGKLTNWQTGKLTNWQTGKLTSWIGWLEGLTNLIVNWWTILQRRPRSQNCGISVFEMLGRFGLGGQVWPYMHNSNQKSSNCNKEVAPKTCHFKQTICRLQKNLILTADVWFCSGCDIGQRSEVALSMKKSLCMLKIYEWIITRIWDQPGMQPMYAMSKVLAWL